MTWLRALPELTLALAWVAFPGLAVLLALGLRRPAMLLAAPAVSVGVLGGLAAVFPAVGISWRRPQVAAAVVAITVVIAVVRVAWRRVAPTIGRARHAPAPLVSRTRGAGRTPATWRTVAIVGGVVLGGLLAAVPIALGTLPDLPRQSYDPVFHWSATRFVIETADASPFHIGLVNNQVAPAGALGFYPAAWHAIAALATVDSVIPATNSLVLVVAGVVWPAGLAALGLAMAPRRPEVAMVAPIMGAGFVAFPTNLLAWGFPNALAVALIPAAAASAISAIGLLVGRSRGDAALVALSASGRAVRVLAALVAALGVALAHPSGLMSWAVLITPYVAATAGRAAWTAARGQASVLRRAVVGTAWALAGALWCVAWWEILTFFGRSLGDFSQRGTGGLREGFWRALTATNEPGAGVIVLVVVIGLGAVVALLQRGTRWIVVSAALLGFLAVLSEYHSDLQWLVRAWYGAPERLRAPLVVALAVVAALGICAVASLIAGIVRRGVPRASAVAGHVLAPAVSLILVAAVVVATGTLWADQRRAFYETRTIVWADPASAMTLVSVPEVEMMARLGEQLTPGAYMLGSPFSGATVAYAVDGVPVVFTSLRGQWSDDARFLGAHLADIHGDPAVCAALDRLGVRYYFTDTDVFDPASPLQSQFAGMPVDAPQPGFELVDEGGSARVYRITACD